MKPIHRALLIIEIIVCFGPVTLLLGLGLIVVPVSILELIDGNAGVLPLVLLEVGGVLGMVAMLSLVLHVLEPSKLFLSHKKLMFFTASGVISLLFGAVLLNASGLFWLVYVLPLLAAFHLLYLSRKIWAYAS